MHEAVTCGCCSNRVRLHGTVVCTSRLLPSSRSQLISTARPSSSTFKPNQSRSGSSVIQLSANIHDGLTVALFIAINAALSMSTDPGGKR